MTLHLQSYQPLCQEHVRHRLQPEKPLTYLISTLPVKVTAADAARKNSNGEFVAK